MAKTMKLTAAASVALTAVFAVIFQLTKIDVFQPLAITFGTAAYHFMMRLAVGYAVNGIMHNRADYTKKWYQICGFEQKLYKKLGVKAWKDKLPAYNPSLFSVKDHSFEEIAQATCQAEIVHEIIAVLSFLPIIAARWFGAAAVFIVTSVLSACFDLLFVMIQRYNRPRLVRIANKSGK
ncbi:MAG: hypothetical protein IKK29_05285 [Christensenellaceae bacterium]|nr:hypothetical protein [Christensenellaceae bacterium]